jgi:hypothetical protein
MNKIIMLLTIISIGFGSCERKPIIVGTGCGAKISRYMQDGKSADYQILYSIGGANDSALRVTYTQSLTDIFQKKETLYKKYLAGPPITFPFSNSIPFYTLLCGKDVYVNELASGIEQTINNNNMYMKGTRTAGNTWTHTLNGVKYYMGVASTNNVIIIPVDTFLADRIYIKSVQNIAVADTIYYNDTLGTLFYNGVNIKYIMTGKNF